MVIRLSLGNWNVDDSMVIRWSFDGHWDISRVMNLLLFDGHCFWRGEKVFINLFSDPQFSGYCFFIGF